VVRVVSKASRRLILPRTCCCYYILPSTSPLSRYSEQNVSLLSNASYMFCPSHPPSYMIIIVSVLLSNILSLCSSLRMGDQVRHPYKPRGKIMYVIFLYFKLCPQRGVELRCNLHARIAALELWYGSKHCKSRTRCAGTHWIRGWVGPRVRLDTVNARNLWTAAKIEPRFLGRAGPSLHRLSYAGP
jgi:hypothetical protein